jgi:tetratricopeptide (TPR) repeat protein
MTDTAALDLARAEGLVRQASTAAPRRPLPYDTKGNVLRAQNRFDEAIPEYESALGFDRNRVGAYSHIGQCMVFTGSVDEAVPFYERAMRLSPRDPAMGIWYMRVGIVHLLRTRTNEAVSWLERARNTSPALPNVRGCLASAYALNGEFEHAADELAEARRLSGDDRFLSITRLKAGSAFALPKIRSVSESTYFARLRKAGMPE